MRKITVIFTALAAVLLIAGFKKAAIALGILAAVDLLWGQVINHLKKEVKEVKEERKISQEEKQ
jgi:hypothetical protein